VKSTGFAETYLFTTNFCLYRWPSCDFAIETEPHRPRCAFIKRHFEVSSLTLTRRDEFFGITISDTNADVRRFPGYSYDRDDVSSARRCRKRATLPPHCA